MLIQLQAQANELAVQLETVSKQLALASQVAVDERSRAQVLFKLPQRRQQGLAWPALTCRVYTAVRRDFSLHGISSLQCC